MGAHHAPGTPHPSYTQAILGCRVRAPLSSTGGTAAPRASALKHHPFPHMRLLAAAGEGGGMNPAQQRGAAASGLASGGSLGWTGGRALSARRLEQEVLPVRPPWGGGRRQGQTHQGPPEPRWAADAPSQSQAWDGLAGFDRYSVLRSPLTNVHVSRRNNRHNVLPRAMCEMQGGDRRAPAWPPEVLDSCPTSRKE